MTDPRVYAIVVTFQPDIPRLKELLAACLPQVAGLVVVDNSSNAQIQDVLESEGQAHQFDVLTLSSNVGVAAAQNKGIAWAKAQGSTHILLFDQDSVPAPDMVSRLTNALKECADTGRRVAAVGPRLVDRRTGTSTPFVRFGLWGVKKQHYSAGDPFAWVETDFLVSSGMLIPMETLEHIGLLEDELFIDNVDLEWCFRARSRKFNLYGVYDAVMEHSVGDRVIELGGYVIHLHNPTRQYYIMRNRILLYQRSYSPWGWIVQDFVRMIFKFLAFSLFFRPRCENLSMMLKGIKDGFSRRVGKIS